MIASRSGDILGEPSTSPPLMRRFGGELFESVKESRFGSRRFPLSNTSSSPELGQKLSSCSSSFEFGGGVVNFVGSYTELEDDVRR